MAKKSKAAKAPPRKSAGSSAKAQKSGKAPSQKESKKSLGGKKPGLLAKVAGALLGSKVGPKGGSQVVSEKSTRAPATSSKSPGPKSTPAKSASPQPVSAQPPHGATLPKKAEKGRADAEASPAAGAPAELLNGNRPEETSDEVFLTDAEGRRYCRARDCDQLAVVDGYCRYHYLLFWKRIQVRKKILADGKLERYVEELTAKYPDRFLEILRKDLRSEKDFLAAIGELELEEAANEEAGDFEEDNNYIDEMRGVSSETPIQDSEEY
jgi:hypothetical protein